jgi:hypothetical protein
MKAKQTKESQKRQLEQSNINMQTKSDRIKLVGDFCVCDAYLAMKQSVKETNLYRIIINIRKHKKRKNYLKFELLFIL